MARSPASNRGDACNRATDPFFDHSRAYSGPVLCRWDTATKKCGPGGALVPFFETYCNGFPTDRCEKDILHSNDPGVFLAASVDAKARGLVCELGGGEGGNVEEGSKCGPPTQSCVYYTNADACWNSVNPNTGNMC